MPKFGDTNSEGNVFVSKNRNCASGEYWVTRESFLKKWPGWFEKRERMNENVRLRAIHKAEVKKRKAEKAEAKANEPAKVKQAARRVFANDEERQAARLEYEARRRVTPHYKARVKAWSDAKALPGRIKREEVRAERLKAKEFSRLGREQAAEDRRRLKAAKPKPDRRKRLTDAERKSSVRLEKRNYKHRRRARIASLPIKATAGQIRMAMEKARGRCYYCRGAFKSLTIDHVTPIAKGGGHTLDNIVFCCHACNSEKRDLPPSDYAKKHGLLLV